MSLRENARKPKGIGGRIVLNRMNGGAHAELSAWGYSHLELDGVKNILEVGCGGGANVAKLLGKCPEAKVTGIDYSNVSVKASRKFNATAIKEGRCTIEPGNVMELPYADGSFDLVTAFETIYFWPDLPKAFKQIYRVLAPGGRFFICNEADGDHEEEKAWEDEISGTKVYKEDELRAYLKGAGFTSVTTERNPDKHWIIFIAKKA
ncbi:MAG: class I SAM-dependent methyltransferase [Clostridiales bacterium]|nr:class I SAM-dependent methyltransferase [Clostridiales bacterium]